MIGWRSILSIVASEGESGLGPPRGDVKAENSLINEALIVHFIYEEGSRSALGRWS